MFSDISLPVIRDHLIRTLPLPDYEIVCHIDESVFPNRGERQINIYPTAISPGPSRDQDRGVEFYGAFGIGITVRTGKVPEDRLFPRAYAAQDSLARVQMKVFAILKRDYLEIWNHINDKLPSAWKLVEPYRFQSHQPVIRVGPRHFNADPDTDSDFNYGLWAALLYGDARFMALIEDPLVST